jgi:hypothetical protein
MILAALDDTHPDEGWRSVRYVTLARLVVEQLTEPGSVVVINARAHELRHAGAARARWRRWWA